MPRDFFWFLIFFWPVLLFAEDTELRLYRPFTETPTQLPTVIAEKKNGECWQQAHRIKREDAWRCRAEGKVYDPCFVQRFSAHLDAFCPKSPWSNTGIQIMVNTPLDNAKHERLDMSQTYPWAVELTSGEQCLSVDSQDTYDGLPVHYRCNKQGALIGHVQRCSSMWKMLQHNQQGVTTVEITRAWF